MDDDKYTLFLCSFLLTRCLKERERERETMPLRGFKSHSHLIPVCRLMTSELLFSRKEAVRERVSRVRR